MSVTLISGDDQRLVTDKAIAERSVLVKNILEDVEGDEAEIPLPNVNSTVLKKVIEYCTFHKDDPPTTEKEEAPSKPDKEIGKWDAAYISLPKDDLFDLVLAANYLDVQPLLDLGCRKIAEMISGLPVEEIRELFGIENDFTPEEEEAIRKENEWATA